MSSLAKIAYSRPGRHPIIAGRSRVRKEIMKVHARGKCSLYINNKTFERATRRCDEGKYSASISVRGCLSILDEYKVLRFRLPPSPSRRNKFALARVKRGESPRSAGGRTNRVKEGRGERVRCRSRRTGGGKKKEKEEYTRGNGRGEREEASEKPERATPDCDGNFRNYPELLRARHFLRLALFRPLFVPPPLCPPRRSDRVSTAVSEGNAWRVRAFV